MKSESVGEGSAHAHWDQIFRQTADEGNPDDPLSLSPPLGVVDPYGRDVALSLMTAAVDPDYGEPFLSWTTIESMRDLGYMVAAPEDFNGDGVVDILDRNIWMANSGASGLQIDSMRLGDANCDRVVNHVDFMLWQQAAEIPEPGGLMLFAAALIGLTAMRQR